jgi:hypothetical protein
VTEAAAIAPGLLIADRYRLESLEPDRSAHPIEGRGASRIGQLWRARDEVLARPVAVLLVTDDDPHTADVLEGARAVAGLSHPSLAKVYDAGAAAPGVVFVVTEYFDGDSLEHHLRGGPMDPVAAIDLVAGIADAVAAARHVGIRGLLPAPSRILFTTSGLARLAGIALVGASGESSHAGSEDDDTTALAFLLYAALTARWPGDPNESALPAAPVIEGHLRTPRQVRGGVPSDVDSVVASALGDPQAPRAVPRIGSPAAFAAALEPLRSAPDDGHPYGADTAYTAWPTAPIPVIESPLRRGLRMPARRRHRVGIGVGAAVLAVALGALFWPGDTLYAHFVTHPNQIATPTPTPTPVQATTLAAKSVVEFDPYGDGKDPHVAEAPRAMDGDVSTAWHTQTFFGPHLGSAKPGVGLLVDFGKSKTVAQVRIDLLGAGSNVELLASDGSAAPVNPASMTKVASRDNAGTEITLRPQVPTSGRYWVVWLTELPHQGDGYRGGVAEMTFES